MVPPAHDDCPVKLVPADRQDCPARLLLDEDAADNPGFPEFGDCDERPGAAESGPEPDPQPVYVEMKDGVQIVCPPPGPAARLAPNAQCHKVTDAWQAMDRLLRERRQLTQQVSQVVAAQERRRRRLAELQLPCGGAGFSGWGQLEESSQ